MKKFLSALFAIIGITSTAHADPKVQLTNPQNLNFSMPTIASDDIQFVMPTKESFEGAPQFHEDEWCQLEFFPMTRLAEIQNVLSEYKIFEQKHRIKNGWNEIFARRIKREPIILGKNAIMEIAKSIQATKLPAPILTTFSSPLGQVKKGFSLELPGSVLLYGIENAQGVNSLGALVSQGGDDSQLTSAFIKLSKTHKLLVVDWRAQQILTSVSSEGKINVWYP